MYVHCSSELFRAVGGAFKIREGTLHLYPEMHLTMN